MTDITQADNVEIRITKAHDGLRLWVDVDGRNRCRVYRISKLHLSNLADAEGVQIFEHEPL